MLLDVFLKEGEESWMIDVGSVLANPKVAELAKVIDVSSFNLNNKKDVDAIRKLRDTTIGKNTSEYNNFIELNQNDGSFAFAHTITIEIIEGGRKGTRMSYVLFDNSANKTWNTYTGVTGRKVDTSKKADVERLRTEFLSKNLLPVDSSVIKAAGSRGWALNNYWVTTKIAARPAKAMDRIKPTTISRLYNTEIEFWRQHPIFQRALKKWQDKKGPEKNRALEKALIDAKEDGPTADMVANVPRISVATIKDLVGTSKARWSGRNVNRSFFPQRKKQYLVDLLDHFIREPGNPDKLYPVTLFDDIDTARTLYGDAIASTSSVTADFFEVIHPVAIISGNARGNAQRMILEFLGAKSYEELMKTATISYGATGTQPLVDSYIYNENGRGFKKLQISSKAKEGAAAGVKSLRVAYDEVMNNPTSRRLWEKEIVKNSSADYKDAVRFLTAVILNDDYSWLPAFKLAEIFLGTTEADLKLAYQLAAVMGRNVKDRDDTEEVDEARGGRPRKVKTIPPEYLGGSGKNKFSAKMTKIFYNSGYNGDDEWLKLVTGIWNEIFKLINSNPAFGNIVVWLFNHSATVQMNTEYDLQNNDSGGRRVVLTNVVATWPTQLVDTAEATLGQTGSVLSFKLKINGYSQDFAKFELAPLSNRSDLTTMPPADAPVSADNASLQKTISDIYGSKRTGRPDIPELQRSNSVADAIAVKAGLPMKAPVPKKVARDSNRELAKGSINVMDLVNKFMAEYPTSAFTAAIKRVPPADRAAADEDISHYISLGYDLDKITELITQDYVIAESRLPRTVKQVARLLERDLTIFLNKFK